MTYPRIFAGIAAALAAVILTVAVLPGPQPLIGKPHTAATTAPAPVAASCDTTSAWTVTWSFTNPTGQPLRVVDTEGVFGLVDMTADETVSMTASYPASDTEPIEHFVYGAVPSTWGTATDDLVAHRAPCGQPVHATLVP